jgi:hypothetical protein
MPISNFLSVKIPEELIDVCSKIVKEREELGYRDHMELILDTVNRRIAELQKGKRKGKRNKNLKNLS